MGDLVELSWGRQYLAVEPTAYRIDYAINPFMDPADQPDPARASEQWQVMVHVLRALGARVDVLAQRPDSPDMVYAMNLGLALADEAGRPEQVVLSHMRYAERRAERRSAGPWFAAQGYAVRQVGVDGVGPCFEAGDAFAWGDALVVGYGPRTEELGLKALAAEIGVRVRGVRITHPAMYHLDLAFCPLDDRRAIVCPAAFDEPSAQALLDLVPEPLVIDEAEALTFCANSVVVGRTVVMPACPPRVRAQLEAWGFEVVLLELGEFHKGGGSVRCLTNPLDVVIGRDLPSVAGGEVVLPRPR
ncbi:dimethylarginine dimethylaminohydrolase family protein [Nocardioides massiliensis]|uniref:N-dimethylarginine dimethylaminohydrolase n=1 Tax=Nocardioides massiliensis TaxID=1325935 RepID=A0ABT9NM07_9ACTN|nr:arginine deiminase-related protein [Nocardioides massiliensis]MDP9821449.1 N-dimethylarginine dimethylaminohydrolase [Nocardioides massiliensis]